MCCCCICCCCACACCPGSAKLKVPGAAGVPPPNGAPNAGAAAWPNAAPVLAKLKGAGDWPSPVAVEPNMPPPAGLAACPNRFEPKPPGLAPNGCEACAPPNSDGELAAPNAGDDDAKLNAAELAGAPKPPRPPAPPPKPNGDGALAGAPNAGALATGAPNAGALDAKLNAGVLAGAPNTPPKLELPVAAPNAGVDAPPKLPKAGALAGGAPNAGVELRLPKALAGAAAPNAGVDAPPNAAEPKAGVAGVPPPPKPPNAGVAAGVPPKGEPAADGAPKPSAGVPKPPAAGAPVLPLTPACARHDVGRSCRRRGAPQAQRQEKELRSTLPWSACLRRRPAPH